jgi:ketosteroid isomerase-like protein
MSGDTSRLEPIYADDYVLVPPNGDTLEKREILDDLRRHSMRFTSFEVNDVLIRTKGSVGIFMTAVRSAAVRDGVEIKTYARQLAILSKENERITIAHFQSTNIVGPK